MARAPRTSTWRAVPPGPGEDVPVEAGQDDLSVIQAVTECRREADDARKTRIKQNRRNREAYMGMQDWAHKQKGQSREFLPKVAVAAEQFAAFVKKGLTASGNWYMPKLGLESQSPLTVHQIKAIIDSYLDEILVDDNRQMAFPALMTEAVKLGGLESLIVFKVHGKICEYRDFVPSPAAAEPPQEIGSEDAEDEPELETREYETWRLRLDLISPDNYYPDPSGKGLYEIHETTCDFHEVLRKAEEGIYDLEAVQQLEHSIRTEDIDRQRRYQGADPSGPPSFRKQITLWEFWGTLLNSNGEVAHHNIFCTVANERFLIRKPRPNPFWHQESPFVVCPILRVPNSVWHKALYDHPTELNFAINEQFNLMFDGAMASVWGTRQLRVDDLEDPSDVEGGIPQGKTLAVKSSLPYGAKVLETVTEGQVPADAMAVFEMLSSEFASAGLSTELKMGAFPGRQVKATEVVEMSNNQSAVIDSIASDLEGNCLAPLIRKVWLTILQNMDDIPPRRIVQTIGMAASFMLARMSAAERYQAFANSTAFAVEGLSLMLQRTRDFQKQMALLQVVSTNPMMAAVFFQMYSPDKMLANAMRSLDINPETLKRDAEDFKRMGDQLQTMALFSQMMGSQGGAQNQPGPEVPPTAPGGGNAAPAEVNQQLNPLTGMSPNG